MINIVLLEPEKPSNTGNIGRTCVLTNSRLHLVRPFSFRLDDKLLKRSGMDYWDKVDLVIHDDMNEFLEYIKGNDRVFYVETFATKYYHELEYQDGDFFVFGKESSGIDKDLVAKHNDHSIKIPMNMEIDRSLNLANSCNIVLFEALRQIDFPGLK
ncbi:tRNA (uridine(34)/cytosine(34)/5-carboxymethylaminomethyluridine(34)-2'-O)-methyltransferase TrmL [Finegoldia sp. BIOML-A2]|uniref:tRNA (cytidine(34)-2'-O)-methyltransferase n=1 Tax=Finegoldia TaxID=150022 RepID=UPI000B918E0F|nr:MULTISPECIES: tRNA (cytidine(34)-2'-O)-methyltransferase [Finegoldia]MDU2499403.1 tRNA (cytidine(34)-2'-O)-methyltransferase [Finegoldia magna]MDU5507731.1 tRNA (cytidine(34)-2'-O)-methyltransferase [Finegoldia magna]MDU6879618.1 tRNA (cytidine(34)-2'-O)-methyltransferase [Finegoldia magna]MSA97066.1 tRNA (uridine(34)/cytosine(34)/5-carboxymethylaminomethyluridine(34)-2'-O)-methyltransferase TrmL [Finegoldia sp. BIOML-A5]MSB00338.1 tRNA (uridine(34)/cytosine(34)/5-carboxymethylaminomethylur